MTDKKMRLSEVWSLANGEGHTREVDSYTEKVGKIVLDRIMEHVANTALGAQPQNGDAIEQLRKTLGIASDLAGLDDRRRARYEEIIDELQQENAKLRKAIVGESKSDVELFKFALEMADRQSQRIEKIIDELRKDQRELREAIESRKKESDGETGFLADLGKKYLESRLNSNPIQEFEQMEQYFARRNQANNVTSLEEWKARKEFELREREIEAKERAEERREVRQQQIGETLARILSALRGERGSSPAPELAGLYRYQCYKCGREFILQESVSQTVCPYCGTELRVEAGARQQEG